MKRGVRVGQGLIVTMSIVLTACSGSFARSPGKTPPSELPSATPTAQSSSTPFDAVTPSPVRTDGLAGVFAGRWFAHSTAFYIDPSGSGIGIWRVYDYCSDTPPPCDLVTDHEIISGGFASFVLEAAGATTASGRVVTTSVPAEVPIGPLTARFDPKADLLWLSAPLFKDYPLCGPHAAVGRCGA
jgi:hypothetical protein